MLPKDENQKKSEAIPVQAELTLELERQKNALPFSTYTYAKTLVNGTGLERALVTQLLRGFITPTQFQLLFEYIRRPSGKTKEIRETQNELAKTQVTGAISPTVFETLANLLEATQEKHCELVRSAIKDRWTIDRVKRELKKADISFEETVLRKYEVQEDEKDSELDITREAEHDRLHLILHSVKEFMEQKIEPAVDREPYLQQSKVIEETGKELNAVHDSLKAEVRSQAIMDALDQLFPEAPQSGEPDITVFQVKSVLQQFGIGDNDKIRRVHSYTVRLQHLSLKAYFAAREIQRILGPTYNLVLEKANLKKRLETASQVNGFPIEEGMRFRYKTLQYVETPNGEDMLVEGEEEAQIENIRIDSSKDLLLVTGVGNFTLNRFLKWTLRIGATPIVQNPGELEKFSGMAKYRAKLRKGLWYEFDRLSRDKNQNLVRTPEKFQITEMTDDRITINHPVPVLWREELSYLDIQENRLQQSFTYGEFAKFCLRRDVAPIRTMNSENPIVQRLKLVKGKGIPVGRATPAGWDGSVDTWEGDDTVVVNRKKNTAAQYMRSAVKHDLEAMDEETMTHAESDFAKGSEAHGAAEEAAQKHADGFLKKLFGGGHGGHKDDHSHGEFHIPSSNMIKELWSETTFLAADDIWQLAKAIYTYYIRRWEHNQKSRYATVGKSMPWIGPEMERVHQEAENHEVNEFQQAMEQWGIQDVEHVLHSPKNRDQMKAAFLTLAKKGQLRWDDIHMWETLNNKFLHPGKFIPIPPNHDPRAKDPKTGLTGMDYLQEAIDSLWGEGTYVEWFNQNNSNFNQGAEAAFHKGAELEGDPKNNGGPTGELAKLFWMHKNGYYVDPREYLGLIYFIIDHGKSTGEAKLFYLIQGVAAKNPKTGKTLLPIEKLGLIDDKYLNKFPILDFLTDKRSKKPGQKEVGPWTVHDLEKLCVSWDNAAKAEKDVKHGWPPKAVTDFLWKYAMTNKEALRRLNKGARKGDEMDHDDMHMFFPMAGDELVDNMCGNSVGDKKYFTFEGYANGYSGYSQFIRMLAKNKDELGSVAVPQLIRTVKSFMRFDSILDNRFHKFESRRAYARLGREVYGKPSVVSEVATGVYQKELQELARNILLEYHVPQDYIEKLFKKTGSVQIEDEAKKQKEVEAALEKFGDVLDQAITNQGIEPMLRVIERSNLIGFQAKSTLEKLQKSTELEAQEKMLYGVAE